MPAADPRAGREGAASPGAELRARQPKAIHSALTVLEEVARHGAGVTAQEVSDALGIPRATTYRLINLLVQDEYLVRMPDLRGFALGRKVLELAHLVAPAAPSQAVREVVAGLRASIRGGVHLVRYQGDRMFVLDADPDFPLSDTPRILRDLGVSAMGRLLLAESDTSTPPSQGNRDRPLPEDAAQQIGQLTPGYGCLALPIRDDHGDLVAGLCLSAPQQRIEEPGALLVQLRDGAARLAPLLA
ncbi:MAG: transcriptional regulator [Cryobacterium sp.]|nr:transcriptional regulator [Cryobacterium sp.]